MQRDTRSDGRQAARLRRMVYVLFAIYWVLVAACLIFPRMTGDPGESVAGITAVGMIFLLLLLIALVVSLSLAFFTFRYRGFLAAPDLVMGWLPLAFSVLAVISLWRVA